MFKSKFIIECNHPEYWEDGKPKYLRKIGPHEYNIEWTDDIYKAKTYETKQRADKEMERMLRYIKTCHDNGWTSFGYNYVMSPTGSISGGYFQNILESVDAKVLEITISIVK